ncbi:MAG: response regulator [Chloroflexi bacterium]|nr:response regulator [Chloroflexota bacterium]
MVTEARPKVLCVDDDERIRDLLAETLCGNYVTIQAGSGSTALQLAREEKPALILLDVMMQDMTGFEVCRRLKSDEATRDVMVIIVTGMGADSEVRIGLAVGAEAYVTKPFSPADLLAKVDALLRGQR